MAGMDEKMMLIGDWVPNPSPRTLMSNFLNEEFGSKSFSDFLAENGNEGTLLQSEEQNMASSKEEEAEDGFGFSSKFSFEPSLFDGQKSSTKGGLAQRMARSGFYAPTLNTACIRSANMANTPSEVRSPYLTIPPGLSPTTLLDSPVFLSNSMAQTSPTTGKLFFAQGNGSNSVSVSAVPDKSKDDPADIIPGGFAFKPHLNTTTSYFSSRENKGIPVNDQLQSLQSVDVSVQKDINRPSCFPESFDRKDDTTFCPKPSDSFVSNENDDQPDAEGDARGELSSAAVAAPAEDEYNWRKYGQKQVKGSEYPRSYYKCTHTNCQVKKKVERSREGHVTEIIYKGAHNHPKPPPSRRSVTQMDGSEPAEFGGDPSASVQSHYGSPEAIDASSTLSNEEEEEEEEDRATHGSVSIGGGDGEGDDETESKRRKLDACNVDTSAGSRSVREPRVVVQTTSEVDILDDGYRWRKYGQKVVKGNPNPRSYYKCTSPGCNVRKHVERASHDLKAVITTYEGKHIHDVPAARSSGHSNSGPTPSNAGPGSAAQPQMLHHRRRPEPGHGGGGRTVPLGSFSLPGRGEQLNLGAGFSFGMGLHGLGNLGMGGGLGPLGPVHPYMGPNRQGGGNGGGFMVAKEEPVLVESGLPMSSGMAAYHQLMNKLPLGPQPWEGCTASGTSNNFS